jgi:hypothetical protein
MGKTATDTMNARDRARAARARFNADRAARDKRIEDATTEAYAALDQRGTADTRLERALAALRAEGETVATIATLTGLSEAEVRRYAPTSAKKATGTTSTPSLALIKSEAIVRLGEQYHSGNTRNLDPDAKQSSAAQWPSHRGAGAAIGRGAVTTRRRRPRHSAATVTVLALDTMRQVARGFGP